jgi:hypothetical protein
MRRDHLAQGGKGVDTAHAPSIQDKRAKGKGPVSEVPERGKTERPVEDLPPSRFAPLAQGRIKTPLDGVHRWIEFRTTVLRDIPFVRANWSLLPVNVRGLWTCLSATMRKRINVVLAIISCLLLIVSLAKWVGLWGYHYAASDAPALGLEPGQKFLSIGCCYSVSDDDLILFSDGKRDYVRRVSKVLDNGQFRIEHPEGGYLIIDAQDISGKVIYRF